MENTVRANGGVYNAVEWGVPTGWNPLQLEPTLKNISFLKEFIAELALGGTSRELSDEDKRDISTAVDSVMTKADKAKETNNVKLHASAGDENRVSVSKLLFPWVDGDYKWVFNNKTDNLELGKVITALIQLSFLKKAIRVPNTQVFDSSRR
jgi:type IV secretion system protein VirB4